MMMGCHTPDSRYTNGIRSGRTIVESPVVFFLGGGLGTRIHSNFCHLLIFGCFFFTYNYWSLVGLMTLTSVNVRIEKNGESHVNTEAHASNKQIKTS